MKNPFSPDSVPEQPLNRNGFDLSKSNLFTTEWGRIMPLYNVEVIPGDTFNLDDVTLDIQGMPTIFPLLSKVDVSVSYYYCRNRNVHDEFEDFIFSTKDVECPWLRMDNERAKQMISTNSLMESFGVPSIVGSNGALVDSKSLSGYGIIYWSPLQSQYLTYTAKHLYSQSSVAVTGISSVQSDTSRYLCRSVPFDIVRNTSSIRFNAPNPESVRSSIILFVRANLNGITSLHRLFTDDLVYTQDSLTFVLNDYSKDLLNTFVGVSECWLEIAVDGFQMPASASSTRVTFDPATYLNLGSSVDFFTSDQIIDSTDDSVIDNNVFVGNDPVIRLNAFLPRHYEMVCNYYYRNDKNNPYMLNGEPQYNEFIPTHASGPDDNVYGFHYRNYELDRFTSCTQSPQFGDAPLVGLTYNVLKESADLTFQDSEGKSYNVTVGIDGDGRLSSIADFSKDIPSANLRKLQEMVNYGVSINDLRVTNSFQRFKENVLRRGLRYRNQMMSHFHTSVDYPDIDIPQYIGGFNGTMNAVRNENTAASEFANLGDFNGGLYGNFRLQNPISFRVPEHGFIIGLVTIVPIPAYPQSIEKSLIKTDPFEFFLPEFAKIGNVPVTYREVMPLQNAAGQSPDDVFGYNKAWYEYMRSIDEIHGDFKTSLSTFSVARQFAERPELSEDFTTVNPDDLNHVFIADNIADKYNSRAKFLCHSYHTVRMQRPIPVIGTPSIE